MHKAPGNASQWKQAWRGGGWRIQIQLAGVFKSATSWRVRCKRSRPSRASVSAFPACNCHSFQAKLCVIMLRYEN